MSNKYQAGTRVLYIAGAGHSGSTLLNVLLENHPKLSAVGELHRLSIHLDTRKCGCGDIIVKCHYWDRVVDQISRTWNLNQAAWWHDFPVSNLNIKTPRGAATRLLFRAALIIGSLHLLKLLARISGYTREFLTIGSNSWKLCDAIATVNDSEVVVDSTKVAPRLKVLYLLNPRTFKVLHLVRDGRAYAASERRRLHHSIATAAIRWVRTNRQILAVLKSIPSSHKHFLRYEDLCDNPETELKALMDFLNLEFDQRLIELNSDVHTIPGNHTMLEKLRTEGMREIRKDKQWEKSMTAEDLRDFESIAGGMNQRFGYQKK